MKLAGETDVEAYLTALSSANRRPSSVSRALVAVRSLHRWCGSDAAAGVDGPIPAAAEPSVLTEAEVASFIGAATGPDPTARRDRALIEVLYATGARISEVVGLRLTDVEDTVVRFAGSRQRIVPYGLGTADALDAWLSPRGRQQMTESCGATGAGGGWLFVNRRGGRLSRQWGWAVVQSQGERAGLGDRLGPHVLRHSFAAHLAAGGAPPSVVQQLLVGRPQVLGPEELVEGYRRWHPRSGARAPTGPCPSH